MKAINIKKLTLTSINQHIEDLVGEKSKKAPLTSSEAIEIDLAGVQLLMAYHKEYNVKIYIQLNDSSLELLMKTGFHKYIDSNKFVLQ